MKLFKFNKTSLFLSILIALFCSITSLLLTFFFLKVIKFDVILLGIFIFIFTCSFSYLLLHNSYEKLIIKRINELYNSLFPATTSSSILKSSEDIELLTRNLKKLNIDKNLEIEDLKNQDNFRKEFMGNIAHELKTPLFTIQGYILTLLDGGISDEKIIKKYLKQTSKGVDRLTYIVKDLDLITKFESGISKLEINEFNILTTIDNAFEMLEIQAQKNNITIKLDRKYNKPIMVIADEERIQQVITNLIMNSIKYGIDRGITEISINPLEENKILVRISDNGEGIDKEHLPRLFERFYRVEKTRNRKSGGSGLGLSIVKHIIDAHNEKIFVESQVNVGSEFSFSLTCVSPNDLESLKI